MSADTQPQDVLAALRAVAPFDQMSAEALDLIVHHHHYTQIAPGNKLLTPEQGQVHQLFIILDGVVAGTEPQRQETIWELTTGEIFPIGALLAERPVTNFYVAETPCRCLVIEQDIFLQLMQRSPEFSDFCTRRIAHLLQLNLSQQQEQSTRNLTDSNRLQAPLDQLFTNTLYCVRSQSIRHAMQQMSDNHKRSIAIVDDQHKPLGILTLRDVMERIALPQLDIDAPITTAMTADPLTLAADRPGYDAAITMAEHGFGHICVVDNNQKLLGIVSERDLFSLQQQGLASLSRAIQHAEHIEQLAQCHQDIEQLILQMQAQGMDFEQLTTIITNLNDRITERIIRICLQQYPDVKQRFTWLAFGSEGRMEQTLVTDQDNGMIFIAADDNHAQQIRQTLLPLAQMINQALDQCGYPLCKGNIMASNPECCLSLDEWQQRFTRWITQGTPEHLLKASIFFDFRVLYGDESLAQQLRQHLFQQAKKQSRFLAMMAGNALNNTPPLGLIREFRTMKSDVGSHSIDLKINGITPIVDCARIFSLANTVSETNTLKRLHGVVDKGQLNAQDVQNWLQAWQFIQSLRTQNHLNALRNKRIPTNHIDISTLSELQRRILKEAFRQVSKLQRKLAMEYAI